MGKLMVGLGRFLPLCALLLALPDLAAAQCVSQLTVQSVLTQDAAGNNKTTFAPGESIRIVGQINNAGAYMLAANGAQVSVTTSFYTNTKPADIPSGVSPWTWNTTAPSGQSSYTVTVKVYDHFCGVFVSASASFTVGQSSLTPPQASAPPGQSSPPPGSSPQHPPLPPTPGWYHNGAGTILGVSAVLYQDSAGLRITWQNSYIYQHPGQDPLYWYAEVIYFNMGKQTLPVSCVGRTNPSLAKEHMRGTANSGSVAADETFCSRNPNFTTSLGPGGTHTEWAIFHNVPWQGGEVSLEWMPYGFSEWVDSWYSPYPSATPPPAECPPELVTLGTCQPANQPGQVLPPRFVILGGQSAQGNQGTQLTPEQLQQFQNAVLCTTDVAVHIIPGLGEVKVVANVVSAVMVGNDVIAIVQDPNNPINYFALVLEFVPFGSCFELLGSMFIPPYKPAIIPPGVATPMPVPTPTPPRTQ